MKPIFPTAPNSRRFPLIEFNYQPVRLADYRAARCVRTVAPSFRSISREYFQTEARRDFLGELFLFAAIVLTAAAPFLSTASALTQFCRAIA